VTTWKHDELAHDLAEHLRAPERMIWTNMQLGPSGSPRPDVYSVPKSYSKFTPLAYECKVSMADFRADVTKGKWQSYLPFASGVYFAAPAGLLTKADLPPGCGLIVRGPDGWRTLKAPTLRTTTNLPLEAWQKLLIDGVNRLRAPLKPGSRDQSFGGGEYLVHHHAVEAIRQKLGKEVAEYLRDQDGCQKRLEYAQQRAAEARKDADDTYRKAMADARQQAERDAAGMNKIRADLRASLGLSATATDYEIRRVVRALSMRLDRDEEVSRLRRQLEAIKQALEFGLEPVPQINPIQEAAHV
jgi:hypothetical protein